MNLSHTLLNALRQHGAREIFGIPGDFVLAFFQQIVESGILPLYTLSHEPAVGFAADALGTSTSEAALNATSRDLRAPVSAARSTE